MLPPEAVHPLSVRHADRAGVEDVDVAQHLRVLLEQSHNVGLQLQPGGDGERGGSGAGDSLTAMEPVMATASGTAMATATMAAMAEVMATSTASATSDKR